ncbi:hypothetical protein HDZ31DRAFT_45496 [Schizophyllum fasciatum]
MAIWRLQSAAAPVGNPALQNIAVSSSPSAAYVPARQASNAHVFGHENVLSTDSTPFTPLIQTQELPPHTPYAQAHEPPFSPARMPSPEPVAPPVPPRDGMAMVPPSRSPPAGQDAQFKNVFNIYSRDMLPAVSNTTRDPHWKGADAEKINVMMPVCLLDCWLILFNASQLKEIHFWRIIAGDSARTFPIIDIRQVESLLVHSTDAWLTNLLNSLLIEQLTTLEVYYSNSCGSHFTFDKPAYHNFFSNAISLNPYGVVLISPNHPVYAERASELEGSLRRHVGALALDWTFCIRDLRSKSGCIPHATY